MRTCSAGPVPPNPSRDSGREALNDNGRTSVPVVEEEGDGGLHTALDPQDLTWIGGTVPIAPATDRLGEIARWAIARTRVW